MDDNIIETNRGRFEYDPDFDYYRRVPEPKELTHLSQFGWVYICVGILAIAVYFR
jgi:hypothetical protein